jgi:DNA-binding NarL/FixJ family response regulator
VEHRINCDLLAERFDFTKRETEVFSLLVLGKENKEIAGELDVSLATAKRLIYNIYSKLGGGTRLECSRKLYT